MMSQTKPITLKPAKDVQIKRVQRIKHVLDNITEEIESIQGEEDYIWANEDQEEPGVVQFIKKANDELTVWAQQIQQRSGNE